MNGLILTSMLLLSVVLAPAPAYSQNVDGATLYRSGVEAIAAEDWDRASQLLEAAYEASPGADRNGIAFNWGLAVSQQGRSILRQNATAGDPERNREGIATLERALLILELTTDPRGGPLRVQIRSYLAEAGSDPR